MIHLHQRVKKLYQGKEPDHFFWIGPDLLQWFLFCFVFKRQDKDLKKADQDIPHQTLVTQTNENQSKAKPADCYREQGLSPNLSVESRISVSGSRALRNCSSVLNAVVRDIRGLPRTLCGRGQKEVSGWLCSKTRPVTTGVLHQSCFEAITEPPH